jgi:hypothetical protein
VSKIKIEDIEKQVSEHNWKLISTEYHNLDSELIFKCNEGHEVYASWKKMRTKLECPVCKSNIYKGQSSEIIPKKKGQKRILALD